MGLSHDRNEQVRKLLELRLLDSSSNAATEVIIKAGLIKLHTDCRIFNIIKSINTGIRASIGLCCHHNIPSQNS
ncbi:hypothetical protein Tco_1049167 [Tanacetum coccineum]